MEGIKQKLAALRADIGAISKNKENPFYESEYFDINELIKQLQPHLEKYNLLLTQPITGGQVTTLIEDVDSDQKVSSHIDLPDLQDPQKMGSAITYYRRYTLQSLLALQAADDDGNKASGKTTAKRKTDDDDKEWLNEGTKDWMNAEKKVESGKIQAKDLRDYYKVSNAAMEYFQSLEDDRRAEIDREFDNAKDLEGTPF